jgi:hypothetical protein
MTETRKTTQDPAEATNEMIERSTAAAKTYTAAASAATIAGLRTAFDLQNGFIAASRSVVDAAVAANAKLADQAVGAVKAAQTETTKLVEAGNKLFSDSLQTKI